MQGLLISRKHFFRVFLFQEKPDGDPSTEPKTDPESAGARHLLQGDGDPGSTPGVSSTQLSAKLDQLGPTSAAAPDPPVARFSLGPREPALLRWPSYQK